MLKPQLVKSGRLLRKMKIAAPGNFNRVKVNRLSQSQGFTILELMVALSILSVLLIMSTVVLIQIGRLYSKGVNEAALQNATRNITADISSAFQFSGREPFSCTPTGHTCYAQAGSSVILSDGTSTPTYSYCIGRARYSYVLGHVADKSALYHVMWRDTMKSLTSCPPLNLSQKNPRDSATEGNGGYEMVPDNTRLNRFKITNGANGDFNIDVWMAYGDDDLLNIDSATGHSTCKNTIGMEFCAVSELSTSVARRIN